MVAKGDIVGTLVRKNSNDWDLAAADAILREAGGQLVDQSGDSLIYNRKSTTRGVLAASSGTILDELIGVTKIFPQS